MSIESAQLGADRVEEECDEHGQQRRAADGYRSPETFGKARDRKGTEQRQREEAEADRLRILYEQGEDELAELEEMMLRDGQIGREEVSQIREKLSEKVREKAPWQWIRSTPRVNVVMWRV